MSNEKRIFVEIIATFLAEKDFFMIHPLATERKNCAFCKVLADVPSFLIDDGAVAIKENGVELHAVEGIAFREFPVYICYEPVSEENKEKVPGKFGAWSKDNGAETLIIDEKGKCYNKPSLMRAALLKNDKIPEWVLETGFPIKPTENGYDLFRNDWNEHKKGENEKSIWIEYGKNDINILTLSEESAEKYVVSVDNHDIGKLSEVFDLFR